MKGLGWLKITVNKGFANLRSEDAVLGVFIFYWKIHNLKSYLEGYPIYKD